MSLRTDHRHWAGSWTKSLSLLLFCFLLLFNFSVSAAESEVGAGSTVSAGMGPASATTAQDVSGRAAKESAQLPSAVPAKEAAPSDAPAAGHLKIPSPPTEFSEYDGGWFKMAYHPSLSAKAHRLIEQADQSKADLTALLGKPVLNQVTIYIGRTAGEMETLAPEEAGFPRYAAGVAFSELGFVLLTASPRYPGQNHDLVEVFRHELAHIALHDAVGRENIPRWFNEGFAIHASKEAQAARLQSLWTATLSDNLIPFSKLTRSFPADENTASVAYAQAADMLRFLLRTDEAHRFESLIQRLGRGQSFDQALNDAYATDMYSLEKQWREDVARRYTFWPVIFGGSLVWFAAFGLMIGAYIKRKRRAKKKLARWEQEEAMEDARHRLAHAVLQMGGAMKFVFSKSAEESPRRNGPVLPSEGHEGHRPVPTVEHDGENHTLH